MYENELEAMRKVKKYLENRLAQLNSQIFHMEKKQNENVATKTVVPTGTAVSLHPPLEHSDKGKSATKRRASGGRRT